MTFQDLTNAVKQGLNNSATKLHNEILIDLIPEPSSYLQKFANTWDSIINESCKINEINPNEAIEIKNHIYNGEISINMLLKMETLNLQKELSNKLVREISKKRSK